MSITGFSVSHAPARSLAGQGQRLIYLMGASGSGKDTLLRLMRAMLQPDEPVLTAHRYITRASSDDESSVPLTPSEFQRRRELGCFALHWQSHGLHYGIGIEIDAWLASKALVIVNGSRHHLPIAHARYPRLNAIEITASPEILASRLAHRARENPEQIASRLRQGIHPYRAPEGCRINRLANEGSPQDAAQRLLTTVRHLLAT
ncbi:phosphonate metabolism protein/1,5-bisphosphokinase (PRPP-forming) PhnN [Bordetella sp. 02P26C-1]|uniref:phosphonate metabolism protein/1,5-bisphosphokinase (PRPP-forming) PhnN n=1 Tax=Bordetella sp. 02P26C-1 TaxID=2683195 RepID=UPI0013528374|nr:phosphonate metabolism protein/1,5-bisphosphokinase (PRPP-forming) PhnN [Bordetella sp. 02P26C-1]MVW79586.1 phosphonate metabolism protein/1,5-bisphosphokinase (PRPP-forming) PhnN [Bordetella sp. 02P26C-1]